MFVTYQLSSSAAWLGVSQLLSWRLFLVNYTVMVLTVLGVWSAFYYLWVHILSLPYPMPFIGVTGFLTALPLSFLILVLIFPHSWTAVQSFKTRRKYFMLVIVFTQLIFCTYFGLEIAFVWLEPGYQWILALALPLIREGLTHIFGLLTTRAAGKQVRTGAIIWVISSGR